jgi:hypothetical protein
MPPKVNSGMKAAMMIRAEKKMALSTSLAARSTIKDRPEKPREPLGAGWRRAWARARPRWR